MIPVLGYWVLGTLSQSPYKTLKNRVLMS